MKTSNIFVYLELSKLAEGLTTNVTQSKAYLKSQASYFNIIPAKYFSDDLSSEWESIVTLTKKMGPKKDEDGRIVNNAFANTISQMSPQECVSIAARVLQLNEKVKMQFQ